MHLRLTMFAMRRVRCGPPLARASALSLVCAAAAAAHAQTGAATVSLTCPATLNTTQSVHGAVSTGWTAELANPTDGAGSAATHRLSSVQFTSGPLRDRAFLVPENADAPVRRGRPVAARWVFSGPDTPTMVCQYRDTAVRLTQPVPAGTTRCEAVRDTASPAVVGTVRCRR